MSNQVSNAQLAARPIVSVAAWSNNQRREGINPRTQQPFNDGHFNIKVQLNTVKLAEILAAALTKGELSIEISGSMWGNEDVTENQPVLSGNANMTRDMIEARKVQKALEQAQAAAGLAANLAATAEDEKEVVNA